MEHHNRKEMKLQRMKEKLQYKYNKQQLKNKYATQNNPISTTKKLIGFLFANCTFIEIFTCVILWKNITIMNEYITVIDYTPLNTLLGAVVGEVIAFAVYSIKSLKENTSGGIVYDKAICQNTSENIESINVNGDDCNEFSS